MLFEGGGCEGLQGEESDANFHTLHSHVRFAKPDFFYN